MSVQTPRAARLARLPKVDLVLDAEPLRSSGWKREIKRRLVRDALAELRRGIEAGEQDVPPDAATVAAQVHDRLLAWSVARPRRVLNATGCILHTNLGRAPLSAAARDAMIGAAGYCDLEVGLDDGKRGSRFVTLRPLLAAVTGAEDVHLVNNNAAALLLAVTVLGAPGGVALSRGQMVEIGDGFRVATMASAGGARVVPVGSTNRTHLSDYEQALAGEGAECGGVPASALLWVHQSNFVQRGYVKEVALAELAALARRRDVPLIADLGSGSLGGGLPGDEPTISEYLAQGVDLVLASGDKLLGGPQGGVIAGRAARVERCRKHPMARALRPDKSTLAAMHATAVAHGLEGAPRLPLHAMASVTVDELMERARAVAAALGWPPEVIVSCAATIGGGSLPGDEIPSVGLAVPTDKPSRAARLLRLSDPPILGRIDKDRLVLDLRTLDPSELDVLIETLRAWMR
jgi:L-seryl-tRNA(Ser) seleniumtransferase